jgi:hypothetical protein
MTAAGWYDCFCEAEELKPKLDAMFPKVKQLAQSGKIDIDGMYVFFKNNCPYEGPLYDDFRFCDIKTGDLIYTVIPVSYSGQAEVWGRENNFHGALVKGTWNDIANFFIGKTE